jgi:hypothetical protein
MYDTGEKASRKGTTRKTLTFPGDGIKMGLREIEWDRMDWIYLVQ